MRFLCAVQADTYAELGVLIHPQYLLDLLYHVFGLESICDDATSGCAAVCTEIGHKLIEVFPESWFSAGYADVQHALERKTQLGRFR